MRPILVFQMAKVASRSWLRLLEASFEDRPVVHFHSISTASLAMIDAIEHDEGPNQTIRHIGLSRLGIPPASIAPQVRDGRWIGPPVDIVAGMRDPVARAVSAVGFISNRLGYTRDAVTIRDHGTAENLRALFFRALRVAQGADDGGDTLLRILAHAIFDYRRWFAGELASGFGVDIADAEFDRAARALHLDGGHRLLVYRVEDLTRPDPARRLRRSASAFFARDLAAVPAEDVSREGRYRTLYDEFAGSLRLSDADLDWFYDDGTVRTFYTPEEITAFRDRWRAA